MRNLLHGKLPLSRSNFLLKNYHSDRVLHRKKRDRGTIFLPGIERRDASGKTTSGGQDLSPSSSPRMV